MNVWKLVLLASSVMLATEALADAPVAASSGTGFVEFRAGPGTIYFVERALPNGTQVQVVNRSGDWAMVQLSDGLQGWIRAKHLLRQRKATPAPVASAPEVPMPYTSVVWPGGGNLNLRAGPGTRHSVLQAMHAGSWVEVTEREGSWVRVRHESGAEGWTFAKYLTR